MNSAGPMSIHAEDGGLRLPVTRRQTLDMLAAGGLAALGTLARRLWLRRPRRRRRCRAHRLSADHRCHRAPGRARHGLLQGRRPDAERPTLIRGWSPLVEAFAAGKFNLVHLLKPIPVWMRYNNNFPVKIMAWAHTNGSGVVVGKDTGIKSFADLGGKQIAVPFWYSMHNIVLQYALRQSGIKPVIKSQGEPLAADECNLQVMAPPDMPAALAAKKIHGYIVAEPFNALGEIKAGGRMLRFTGDIWKNHPCCVLCMHEEVVTKKPEWTQKVMNALVRAEIYASRNKKEVAKLLSTDGDQLSAAARADHRAGDDLLRRCILRPDGRHRAPGMEYRPHRFPALALSVGDQTDRQGDERNARRRRRDIPEKARSGIRRQGSGQLRLRPQRDEQISGMEERPERQSGRSLQSHRGAGAVSLGSHCRAILARPPRAVPQRRTLSAAVRAVSASRSSASACCSWSGGSAAGSSPPIRRP